MLSITLLVILIMMYVTTKSLLQGEVDRATNNAIYQTMKILEDERYPIISNEELISEFKNNLFIMIQSDSAMIVRVYGIDYEKGFLDVEVILQYKHALGFVEEVKSRRSMIIEATKKDEVNYESIY